MRKLTAVEEAKALMMEARQWPVWRWLLEKGRVRAVADRATDALTAQEKRVKAAWPDELKAAYRGPENGRTRDLDSAMRAAAQKVRKADEAAEAARLDAEATFDEAERRLSADLARQGTQKAIHSWELREQAIRKAESAREMSKTRPGETAGGAGHPSG
ncbi:MAG TPA: hypothetical protein VKT49_20165 [Bryobacteraceae bacterium]|nr:hypothetical protein [Bryobacteraceae bacterium]